MFTKNLMRYIETGIVGNCPVCNSNLKVDIISLPNRENVIIKCPACNKQQMFLGKNITKS